MPLPGHRHAEPSCLCNPWRASGKYYMPCVFINKAMAREWRLSLLSSHAVSSLENVPWPPLARCHSPSIRPSVQPISHRKPLCHQVGILTTMPPSRLRQTVEEATCSDTRMLEACLGSTASQAEEGRPALSTLQLRTVHPGAGTLSEFGLWVRSTSGTSWTETQ